MFKVIVSGYGEIDLKKEGDHFVKVTLNGYDLGKSTFSLDKHEVKAMIEVLKELDKEIEW